jgi:hypothetical protein
VENRSLGRGRVSVPVLGLGTWQRLEAAAAAGQHRELIQAAVAAGIRLIDTSPCTARPSGCSSTGSAPTGTRSSSPTRSGPHLPRGVRPSCPARWTATAGSATADASDKAEPSSTAVVIAGNLRANPPGERPRCCRCGAQQGELDDNRRVAGQRLSPGSRIRPATACTGSAAPSAIRRQRNHAQKIIDKPYAGQPHVHLKGGWGTGRSRHRAPTANGVQAGLCRSVRAAPADRAARGPGVGGGTGGVPGGGGGRCGGGTAGSVHWLGCSACPGRCRAESRPVRDA